MKQTVIEVDLVGYSRLLPILDQGLGPGAVAEFNSQIQGFIDAATQAAGLNPASAVNQRAGDGAIVLVETAENAYRFAVALHMDTSEHNRTRNEPLSKRYFRVGVATGDLHVSQAGQSPPVIAGEVIARACRLETKSPAGGMLIDDATYRELRPNTKATFSGPETIQLKPHDPVTQAWRLNIIAPAIIEAWRVAAGIAEAKGDAAISRGARQQSSAGAAACLPTMVQHAEKMTTVVNPQGPTNITM